MRPLMEKLIRKGKQGGYQGNVFLIKTLYTRKAVNKLKKDIVPRYKYCYSCVIDIEIYQQDLLEFSIWATGRMTELK